MTGAGSPDSFLADLDECDAALRELEVQCCEPGRGPSMQTLATTLGEVRTRLGLIAGSADAAGAAISTLEDARSQVRTLQVGCCAPDRLPYYTMMLEGLSRIRLTVTGISTA